MSVWSWGTWAGSESNISLILKLLWWLIMLSIMRDLCVLSTLLLFMSLVTAWDHLKSVLLVIPNHRLKTCRVLIFQCSDLNLKLITTIVWHTDVKITQPNWHLLTPVCSVSCFLAGLCIWSVTGFYPFHCGLFSLDSMCRHLASYRGTSFWQCVHTISPVASCTALSCSACLVFTDLLFQSILEEELFRVF